MTTKAHEPSEELETKDDTQDSQAEVEQAETDALDDYLNLQKRRRRKNLLRFVGLLVVGVCGYYLLPFIIPKPVCNVDSLTAFEGDPRIPKAMIYRVCQFPPKVEKMFKSAANSPNGYYQNMIVLSHAAKRPELFLKVCTFFSKALQVSLRVYKTEQMEEFQKFCDLKTIGLKHNTIIGSSPAKAAMTVAAYQALHTKNKKIALRVAKYLMR